VAQASVNGFEMYYEEQGTGRPVLFLHGLTGRGEDWRHIGTDLPEGVRWIAPDLRGHGRSGNPSGSLSHRQIAADVLALADHLGLERFDAIGVSQGGNAMLHAATMAPDRVGAMVLVSATPYFPAEARAIMRQSTVESHGEDDWRRMREVHVLGDAQIRALWDHVHALADSYDDMNFTPPLLSTIKARTLIVHGDRDPLYPVPLAVDLFRSIPGAALFVVPGGGHCPIFLEQGPPFVAAVRAWLARAGAS
jgi:pimeloyl-ACP methyl ester carboxylesterase